MSSTYLIFLFLPIIMMAVARSKNSRRSQRLFRFFVDRGAISADTAIPRILLADFEKQHIDGFIDQGVIKANADRKLYFDQQALNRATTNERKGNLIGLAAVLLLGLVIAAVSYWPAG